MIRTGLGFFAIFAAGCSGALLNDLPRADECQSGAIEICAQANGAVGAKRCEAGDGGYLWGSCAPVDCAGSEEPCTTPGGQPGVAACKKGKTAGACGVVVADGCRPGDTTTITEQTTHLTCKDLPCTLDAGIWGFPSCGGSNGSSGGSGSGWSSTNGSVGSSGTPLVFAFHGEPVEFTQAPGQFDVTGRDLSIDTDWVGEGNPWLAFDRNANGRIDDGRELFGSMTELPDGTRARNGFEALAALDEDGDGRITPRDSSFDRLLVWRDKNQDRHSSRDELVPVRDWGLVAIELDYRVVPRCVAGNCEMERAHFVYRDARGTEHEGDVVDVHLTER
jgi:hypothetical protein